MDGIGEADGALGTLFVDPAKGVLDPEGWRAKARAGHPIGGDPFSAYCAPDGSLPLWPLAAVLSEAKLARRFVEEVLEVPYAGLRVPGPETSCADGDFLPALGEVEPEIRLGLPRVA